jgi:hypothetical protein
MNGGSFKSSAKANSQQYGNVATSTVYVLNAAGKAALSITKSASPKTENRSVNAAKVG